MCLTMARYGQLQPSTKTTEQDIDVKKQTKISRRVSPVLRALCASVSDLCTSVAICAACWQYGSQQGLL
jgi:hypothetical protein